MQLDLGLPRQAGRCHGNHGSAAIKEKKRILGDTEIASFYSISLITQIYDAQTQHDLSICKQIWKIVAYLPQPWKEIDRKRENNAVNFHV
jgi:flagellin-specific chaperone FliS